MSALEARPAARRLLRHGLATAGCAGALVAVGCGSSGDSSASGAAPKGAVTAGSTAKNLYLGTEDPSMCAGKQYTIGYDVFSDTESFAVLQQKDMDTLAAKLGCVKIIKLIDNADPSTAVKNIKSFVQRHVDGVVLFQVVAAAQPGLMRILDKAKIPVVSTAVPAPGSTFINEDDYKAGVLGGEALAKTFKKRYPDADPWLVIGAFPEGGDVSVKRMDGFRAGVKKVFSDLPKAQDLDIDTAADPAKANQLMNAVLGRIPKTAKVMVAGINDDVTHAMYQAAVKQGRGDDLVVVAPGGVDPVGLKYACQSASYAGVVAFKPETWASYLIPGILAKIQGKDLPPAVFIPTQFLDKPAIARDYPDAGC